MRKLTPKQKQRIKEVRERNQYINQIIVEKIEGGVSPLPLNLMLEARFNNLVIAGILVEGEIAYLQEQEEVNEGLLEVKQKRLFAIKSQLNELNNVADLLKKFSRRGRTFEILEV